MGVKEQVGGTLILITKRLTTIHIIQITDITDSSCRVLLDLHQLKVKSGCSLD